MADGRKGSRVTAGFRRPFGMAYTTGFQMGETVDHAVPLLGTGAIFT